MIIIIIIIIIISSSSSHHRHRHHHHHHVESKLLKPYFVQHSCRTSRNLSAYDLNFPTFFFFYRFLSRTTWLFLFSPSYYYFFELLPRMRNARDALMNDQCDLRVWNYPRIYAQLYHPLNYPPASCETRGKHRVIPYICRPEVLSNSCDKPKHMKALLLLMHA